MKAFLVHFNVAGVKGLTEVVLVEKEENLEKALADKSKKFKPGDSYSKIIKKTEIALSQVKIGELSITEFLLLQNM